MTVAEIQRALLARGYDLGKSGKDKNGVDGDWGSLSTKAARDFQAKAGIPLTGRPDAATLEALKGEVPTAHHSAMSTSDRGLLALMIREGVALEAYLDTASPPVWTIGVGHTAAAGDPKPVKSMRISLAGALSLFRQDIKAYERDVLSAVKVLLAQHEFDALVSFHYNTGGIRRAKLTSLLNAGDRAGAAKAFMGWVTPPSIRPRREGEMRQFQTGSYGDLSTVLVYRGVNSKSHPAQADRVSTEGLLG